MAAADLEILSNDALVDLGAQLEVELDEAEVRLRDLVGKFDARRKPLIKPGVKLALNAALGIAGVSLAPVTLGWSLALTVIGGAITISDAIDFGGDVGRIRAVHRDIVRLRQQVSDIVVELEDIEKLLTRRLGAQN